MLDTHGYRAVSAASSSSHCTAITSHLTLGELPSHHVFSPLLRHKGIKSPLQNCHHVLLQQLLLHSMDEVLPAADIQVVLTAFKLLCQAPLQARNKHCTLCLTQKQDAWMLPYVGATQGMLNTTNR